MVQPIAPVSSGTGHGLILECFMYIKALAYMGLTVLLCHMPPCEGIMPFAAIVLCISIYTCHCSTTGNTTTGLRPPLKYPVL